jgi:hypothetical protein
MHAPYKQHHFIHVKIEKIMEWVASAGKTETPKLLYRSSSDGKDFSYFLCREGCSD